MSTGSLPQLHFVIPGLFEKLPVWQQDFAFTPDAQVLPRLFITARQQTLPVGGFQETVQWLCSDPRLALTGAQARYALDTEQAGDPSTVVLCADPVLLEAGIDQVTLMPSLPVLSSESAERLQAVLNAHVQQDGLRFEMLNGHGYLLSDEMRPLPTTTALHSVLGKSIYPCLPQADDLYWQRLLNEIQMLLHQAAVEGVNALWLWGNESVPARADCSVEHLAFRAVHGGGVHGRVAAQMLSVGQEVPSVSSFAKGSVLQLDQQASNELFIIDDLLLPALQEDTRAWQHALQVVEARDLAPWLEQWQRGECEVHLYDTAGSAWHCQRPSKWKFWQKPNHDWHRIT